MSFLPGKNEISARTLNESRNLGVLLEWGEKIANNPQIISYHLYSSANGTTHRLTTMSPRDYQNRSDDGNDRRSLVSELDSCWPQKFT